MRSLLTVHDINQHKKRTSRIQLPLQLLLHLRSPLWTHIRRKPTNLRCMVMFGDLRGIVGGDLVVRRVLC